MKKGLVWASLLAWLLVLGVSALYAPRMEQVIKAGTASTPGSESEAARLMLDSGDTQQVVLVFSSGTLQVTEPAFAGAAAQVLDKVRAVEGVDQVISFWDLKDPRMAGRSGRTALAFVEAQMDASEAQTRLVPSLRQAVADAASPLEVQVTGEPAIYADLSRAGLESLSRAERVVVPVVLVVLAVIFGSVVAAVLPLGLGLLSVLVSTGLFYFYALHNTVDDSTPAIISMLGMGVGVDYSLFMVTRFREELAAGLDRASAVRRTLTTSGKAILFSGATVVVSVASLYVINNPIIRAMALAMVLVVLVAVLAAVTLLPVLLYWLGHRVNALRLPLTGARPTSGKGFWHRWAWSVMKRPWLFAALAVIPLVALSLPAADMKTGMPNLSLLPAGSEARQGAETLARDFAAGLTDPIDVVIQLKTGTVADHAQSLQGLVAQIQADPAVAAVLPDMKPAGTLIYLAVVPKEGADATATRDLVDRLRMKVLPEAAGDLGRPLVGGGPAELVDYNNQIRWAMPRVIGLVLTITFVVLLLLLRSVVLPLKAIIMNALSVTAAYGALALVFGQGYLSGLLGFTPLGYVETPVMVLLFAVLFGLSMDYEVFLLSRIHEEYQRTGHNEEAVAVGLEQTAGIITGAASIMVVVFGAFVATGMLMVKEFGFGLAVAVFLDATLIRVLLAPAFMRLMGAWNWWAPAGIRRFRANSSVR